MAKGPPPDDLMKWPKGELAKEVARLRAVLREHVGDRPGDDPRGQSTQDPIIGGSPHGRDDALVDTRAAVLLDSTEVVLLDSMGGSVSMLLALSGRINYADDRVEHAYIFGPDGAAGIVSELIGLASRAAGAHGHREAEVFAAEFKTALERRMDELP